MIVYTEESLFSMNFIFLDPQQYFKKMKALKKKLGWITKDFFRISISKSEEGNWVLNLSKISAMVKEGN